MAARGSVMENYPKYSKRRITVLDGQWDFTWLGVNADFDKINLAHVEYAKNISIPGIFDNMDDIAGKRGVAVFRKKVLLSDFSNQLKLKIHGMGLLGKIWFDGKFVGNYNLPYSGVEYDIIAEGEKEHELVIAIDNRFDPDRMPLFLPNYDFYAYGGIYRSVEIHELPTVSIDRVQVTPLDLEQGSVQIKIKLNDQATSECSFSLGFDGKNEQNFTEKVVDQNIKLQLQVPDFKIWSPDAPHLHTIEIDTVTDKICERFGMRTIEADNGKILLNGEPIRLVGFNRHEAHPELGPVQTEQLMIEDLKLLKKMNCNFIRCVHYPQDQRFLDLCDEYGFLVWEETLGWGNKVKQLSDQTFINSNKEQARKMIRNSFNHPAVIIWAFLNEAESNEEGARNMYKQLTDTIREEDNSRLISYASNRWNNDLCFEFVDIVSFNTYPGWINNTDWTRKSTDSIAPHIKQMIEFSLQDDLCNKPLIFSEIGACAVLGWHDKVATQWTEEFQSEYLEKAIKSILGNERFSGLAIWQFSDTRSYGPSGDVRCKPFGYNFAGVVDANRRPKISSKTVEKLYGDFLT
jgi:beta-glucuronidase